MKTFSFYLNAALYLKYSVFSPLIHNQFFWRQTNHDEWVFDICIDNDCWVLSKKNLTLWGLDQIIGTSVKSMAKLNNTSVWRIANIIPWRFNFSDALIVICIMYPPHPQNIWPLCEHYMTFLFNLQNILKINFIDNPLWIVCISSKHLSTLTQEKLHTIKGVD